jgi:4-amino-4-deoxy-L-arabinose transferase-like glycosyltransferase
MKLDRFILILLAIYLLIGAFTLSDYGESWDDHSLQKYADYSLRTYDTWRMQGIMPITDKDLGNYGPAYMMTVLLGSRILNFLPLNPADIRHIFYFLTHLLGVWAFYELAKRWLTQTAARYATLLYVTQPLFWGHSFINPKDTPFLAFFILSLLFGLRMIDALDSTQRPAADSPRWLRVFTTSGVILLLGAFASTALIHSWLETLVRAAANGETNIISFIASDIHKANPEIYIQKYFVFFLWIRAAFFFLSSFTLLFLTHRYSPTIFHSLFTVLFPAALLGFATSIRIIAPFAGFLVALYAFRKLGKPALPILIT